MADTPHIMLPTPVGGTPRRVDGAPSVLFAALYVFLFPFVALRLSSRQSRSILIIGFSAFTIEHVAIWSLRASQAFGNDERRTSSGLVKYIQLSLGNGYIILANDLVPLLRVLLVRATSPPDAVGDAPYIMMDATTAPKARYWTRRVTDLLRLLFLVPLVTNIIAGTKFNTVQASQAAADSLMSLRYASAGSAVFLLVILLVWTIVARFRVHPIRTAPAAADRLIVLICLLTSIGLYRLGVMHFRVPGLLSTQGWAAQQSSGAKALFFVFHALPEWATAALLLIPNTRALFGAGIIGDWRTNDGDKTCAEARKARRERRQEAIEML